MNAISSIDVKSEKIKQGKNTNISIHFMDKKTNSCLKLFSCSIKQTLEIEYNYQ